VSTTIHTGDVLDGLAKIETGTVQTCVTSPPYWGLRDYGTAKWEGGDAACDHKIPSSTLGGGSNKGHGGSFTANYTSSCGKCGSVRIDNQIGLESSPDEFVAKMVAVFREVRRCLRDDGTLWLNLGDSYAKAGVSGLGLHTETSTTGKPNPYAGVCKEIPDGLKPKDLCMIPWRVALALQADGWWLRSVIVWAKKSPMPESVTDRPTSSWEPIFLLAKSERYFYDAEAVKEASGGQHGAAASFARATKDHLLPGQSAIQHRLDRNTTEDCGTRNQRNVWHLGPEPYAEAHFATFPTEIPRRCIMAGSRPGDLVLDPFLGSGTTLAVASQLGRRGVGCELNQEYVKLAQDRIGRATRPNTYQSDKAVDAPLFGATNA